MTNQITQFNFLTPETFEEQTFNPSVINFVDMTDSVLPALNVSERFTPRYGLEFNSSPNMNAQGGNYELNGNIGTSSLKQYYISNVINYQSDDIMGFDFNTDGSINLTDITGAYAIIPFSTSNGDILASYSGGGGGKVSCAILGKRVSNTTFIPYIAFYSNAIALYAYTSDNRPVLLASTTTNSSNTAYTRYVQFNTTSRVIEYHNITTTSSDATTISTGVEISYDIQDLKDRVEECDSMLILPFNTNINKNYFVARTNSYLSSISTIGDLADAITEYVTPITVDKILYLDNTANTLQPDGDTIVIENDKLTSTCQRQFNTGSSLTMTTAMMTGSNGVNLALQSPVVNSIIPIQCFTVSSVSGTQINPSITTSASTGITIPSQNADGNMALDDTYRYVAFSFNPTKDAFITQGTSSSGTKYNRAMLGKMQNDGTFRLIYIQDGAALFKVSAYNNDGTCDFTYTAFSNTSNSNTKTRIMWLNTTDKLMYYYGGSSPTDSALYSSSVTDEFINDFCQCDTIIYSPLTGATTTSAGFGVLHNIGTSGDLVERLASTTLVQPTETYQKSILTVDTTWLTQFIQDTFGITPQS